LALRERYRAVTCDDFEYLALQRWQSSPESATLAEKAALKRARCIPHRNLAATNADERAAVARGHLSLVVLPAHGLTAQEQATLREQLWRFFDARRTLTTHHHIVMPTLVPVQVSAELVLREDALPQQALGEARDRLADYFDPMRGGDDGGGWPFGRPVYASDIYALLDNLPLLDYVATMQLSAPGHPGRLQTDGTQPVAVRLEADELVAIDSTGLIATVTDRRGNLGRRYRLQDGQATPIESTGASQ
jgi:hypothetical protein